MNARPRRARLAAFAAAALTPVLLVAAPASAHTDLVETEPGVDATVNSGTSSVLLAFSDQVFPELAEATVTGADGADRLAGDPIVDGGRVLLPLEPLAEAGAYTVTYRVVASDGHAVEGTYDFTLSDAGAAEAGSVTTPVASDDPFDDAHDVGPQFEDPSGLPVPSWSIAGAGGLGLVVLLRLAARRRDAEEARA